MIELVAMQTLPPIPAWTELHPLVIHFPIALLLVAPLFIVAGIIVNPQKGRPFLVVALSLMVLGTTRHGAGGCYGRSSRRSDPSHGGDVCGS